MGTRNSAPCGLVLKASKIECATKLVVQLSIALTNSIVPWYPGLAGFLVIMIVATKQVIIQLKLSMFNANNLFEKAFFIWHVIYIITGSPYK